MKNFVLLFLWFSLLLGCSKTTYWTSGSCFIPETSTTMEIQITDSIFSTFESNWSGCLLDNSGNAEVRKCRFVGDTLFVYEIALMPLKGDSSRYTYQEFISEVYLQKGRKLYPITWFNPTIYLSLIYELGSDSSTYSIDSSKFHILQVNWGGNYSDTAFLYFNDEYHHKGKYKELRKELRNKMKDEDSLIWYYTLPKEVINDTMIKRRFTTNYWGPLKPL